MLLEKPRRAIPGRPRPPSAAQRPAALQRRPDYMAPVLQFGGPKARGCLSPAPARALWGGNPGRASPGGDGPRSPPAGDLAG